MGRWVGGRRELERDVGDKGDIERPMISQEQSGKAAACQTGSLSIQYGCNEIIIYDAQQLRPKSSETRMYIVM